MYLSKLFEVLNTSLLFFLLSHHTITIILPPPLLHNQANKADIHYCSGYRVLLPLSTHISTTATPIGQQPQPPYSQALWEWEHKHTMVEYPLTQTHHGGVSTDKHAKEGSNVSQLGPFASTAMRWEEENWKWYPLVTKPGLIELHSNFLFSLSSSLLGSKKEEWKIKVEYLNSILAKDLEHGFLYLA